VDRRSDPRQGSHGEELFRLPRFREALERQLASYPSARGKLAAQLAAPLLADETVESARKRALGNYKRITANVEQARQLAAVR